MSHAMYVEVLCSRKTLIVELEKNVKKGWEKLGTCWSKAGKRLGKVGTKVGKRLGKGWEKSRGTSWEKVGTSWEKVGTSWEKVGTSWLAVENREQLGTTWETREKELGTVVNKLA